MNRLLTSALALTLVLTLGVPFVASANTIPCDKILSGLQNCTQTVFPDLTGSSVKGTSVTGKLPDGTFVPPGTVEVMQLNPDGSVKTTRFLGPQGLIQPQSAPITPSATPPSAKAPAAAPASTAAPTSGTPPSSSTAAPSSSSTDNTDCSDSITTGYGVGGGFNPFLQLCKAVVGFKQNGIMPLLYSVLAQIGWLIWYVADWFLFISGLILDNTMYWLVIHMGDFVRGQGSLGITMAWQAIRDLGNLAIIAGFVAVGISTIIQVEQYSANKFFTRLIIAALLINFSYFFAAAIIDAANFTSVAIMRSSLMQQGCKVHTTKTVSGGAADASQYCSIYVTFTQNIKLGTWKDITDSASSASKGSGLSPDLLTFIIGIFAAIFFFTTGYIFFSAAILLIGRFVALILLLIASPIGIAGGNIPIVDGYAGKWWDALWGQALFAPVYFLLVAIGLNIFTSLLIFFKTSQMKYGLLFSGNFSTAVSVVPLIITFIIGIGFMFAALRVAKSMSEAGSEYFGGLYKMLDERLGGLYGNAFNRVASLPSRAASGAYDKAARSIPFLAGTAADRAISNALRTPQNTKMFGSKQTDLERRTANSKAKGERIKELGIQPPGSKAAQQYKAEMEALIKKSKAGTLTPDERQRLNDLVAQSFSKEDLGKMSFKQLQDSGILPHLSPEQARAVFNSKNLTKDEQDQAQKKYFEHFDKIKDTGTEEEIRKELEHMGADGRKLLFETRKDLREDHKIVKLLEGADFESLKKDLSKEKAAELRGARAKGIEEEFTSGDENRIRAMRNRMAKDEFSSVGLDVIMRDEVLRNLKPAQIRRRLEEEEENNAAGAAKLREKILEIFPENGARIIDPHNPARVVTTPQQPQAPAAPVPPPPAPTPPPTPPVGGGVNLSPRPGGDINQIS